MDGLTSVEEPLIREGNRGGGTHEEGGVLAGVAGRYSDSVGHWGLHCATLDTSKSPSLNTLEYEVGEGTNYPYFCLLIPVFCHSGTTADMYPRLFLDALSQKIWLL